MNAADLATLTADQRIPLLTQHRTLLRSRRIANYWRVSRHAHRNSPLGTTAGPSRFSPRLRPIGEYPPFTLLYLAEDLATALYESRFTGQASVAVFERGAHLLDDHGTHDLDRGLVHAALARFEIVVR